MEDKFLKELKEFGNPYEILGLDQNTSDKKLIKLAFKALSIKFHPDKNKSSGSRAKFQQINKAYNFLSDLTIKEKVDSYYKSLKEQQSRYFEQSKERKHFAEDLLKREQKQEDEKQQEIKQKFQEQIRKQQQLKNEMEEAENKKKQQQLLKEQELREQMDNKEFWQKINSIKVKWSKKNKVNYSKQLLQVIFQQYGTIKDVFMLENKRSAIIEYLNQNSAEEAVKESKQNEDESGSSSEGNEEKSDQIKNKNNNHLVKDKLKVKFLMKQKKRNEILEMLRIKKENTNKKQQENIFELNSTNLSKLGDVVNRGSKIISNDIQLQIKREKERQDMIKRIIEENVNDD